MCCLGTFTPFLPIPPQAEHTDAQRLVLPPAGLAETDSRDKVGNAPDSPRTGGPATALLHDAGHLAASRQAPEEWIHFRATCCGTNTSSLLAAGHHLANGAGFVERDKTVAFCIAKCSAKCFPLLLSWQR